MQGLNGSQLIWIASLLYHSRHPDCLRKSSSGGLPYGALGLRKISTGERGTRRGHFHRAPGSGATHSQRFLRSLLSLAWALSKQPVTPEGETAPTRRPGGEWGGHIITKEQFFLPVPSTPHNCAIVANSSSDSVLEAFRRKSDRRSPAPLASPPGAAPLAGSCGSSRTEQDFYRNDISQQQ